MGIREDIAIWAEGMKVAYWREFHLKEARAHAIERDFLRGLHQASTLDFLRAFLSSRSLAPGPAVPYPVEGIKSIWVDNYVHVVPESGAHAGVPVELGDLVIIVTESGRPNWMWIVQGKAIEEPCERYDHGTSTLKETELYEGFHPFSVPKLRGSRYQPPGCTAVGSGSGSYWLVPWTYVDFAHGWVKGERRYPYLSRLVINTRWPSGAAMAWLNPKPAFASFTECVKSAVNAATRSPHLRPAVWMHSNDDDAMHAVPGHPVTLAAEEPADDWSRLCYDLLQYATGASQNPKAARSVRIPVKPGQHSGGCRATVPVHAGPVR